MHHGRRRHYRGIGRRWYDRENVLERLERYQRDLEQEQAPIGGADQARNAPGQKPGVREPGEEQDADADVSARGRQRGDDSRKFVGRKFHLVHRLRMRSDRFVAPASHDDVETLL